MFYVTVWTDFGVPATRSYATHEAAQAWGEFAIKSLGCTRFTIREV